LLTACSENRNTPAVKSEMEKLLSDVRGMTTAKGRKAKLARDLGVSLSRISEWLSGKYEPGGEVTLRLLQWVLAEEAQQKRPGAQTSPGVKTRLKEPNEEKSQSSPGKQ